MANWIRAAALEDCPAGSALETVLEDRIVALFNIDGEVYALDGICPHHGGPIGKGTLQNCVVACPWHGWQFNVVSGEHQSATTLSHPRYQVLVEDGQILVDLESVETT